MTNKQIKNISKDWVGAFDNFKNVFKYGNNEINKWITQIVPHSVLTHSYFRDCFELEFAEVLNKYLAKINEFWWKSKWLYFGDVKFGFDKKSDICCWKQIIIVL